MTDLTKLTLTQAKTGLDKKKFSSVELTAAHLEAVDASKLNAFITVTHHMAMEQARAADARISAEKSLPLDGLPIAVKDLFCTKDVRTTAGSKMLENFTPTYQSRITENLFNAGAVMLGKTNMDEFAMGSANITSYFGNVLNPWGENLVAGGSSGGSAAAVASDISLAALGTDTGGSIRQPASFTGIIGFKPTYGRCSRWGTIAFASSLDQAGPMTKTVNDAILMFENMAGYDDRDSTSAFKNIPDFSQLGNVRGKKIGIPKEYVAEGMDSEISTLWQKGAKILQNMGAEIIDISLPHTKYALPVYYIIAPAEASSNLARYDGVRYGIRVFDEGDSIDDMYEKTRAAGFGTEVKRRIMIGTYVLSAGYYDAYYKKAQAVRGLIIKDFKDIFAKIDAILTPTTPYAAFSIGANLDPINMYLNDIFTVPASIAGLPAISISAGLNKNGLPLGLQLITDSFAEKTLFEVAKSLEQGLEFKKK